MIRRPARLLLTVFLFLSAVTVAISSYYSTPIDASQPFAVGTCAPSITIGNGGVVPDIELSPWAGPVGTPVTVTGCGFDPAAVSCTLSASSSSIFATLPGKTCSISGGNVFASFTVATASNPAAAAPGPYSITVTDGTNTVGAIFQVSFLSITTSTTTSTSTSVVSTSYSTLTTTTSFFSSLTTTTQSSTGRSTETDVVYSYLTLTPVESVLSTTSITVTSTSTIPSTTFVTTTVYSTTVTTVTGFIDRATQLLSGASGALGILALLTLFAPLVIRRLFFN